MRADCPDRCECDWCQWENEITYGVGGGTVAALVFRLLYLEQMG